MPHRAAARIGVHTHTSAVGHRFLDHTSELILELDAPTLEGVLAEAARALGELLGDGGGAVARREVSATAGDDAALLAAWLEELVFLAETEGFVPCDAEVAVTGTVATGTVLGVLGSPPHLVKAVTYNELELRPEGGGWVGRAVLDV
jgi:SHS2 domain-containing protein